MPTAEKPQSRTKKDAARPPRLGSKLSDALAEAGWAKADHALAEAIIEFAELGRAMSALAASDPAKARADDALALVGQALMRAARRRGLTRFGAIGAIEPFAPGRHEVSQAASSPPERVKIVTEGVMRGSDVLIPAKVKAVRAPRKKARP